MSEQVEYEDSGLEIILSIDGEEVKSVSYSKDDKSTYIEDAAISYDSIIDLKFSGHRKAMARFIKSLDKNYDISCEIDDENLDDDQKYRKELAATKNQNEYDACRKKWKKD